VTCRIDMTKAPRQHRCSRQHAELVDGYQSARTAQEARAEAYSAGYATELAEFYRDVEPRVLFKDWLIGSSQAALREGQDGDG